MAQYARVPRHDVVSSSNESALTNASLMSNVWITSSVFVGLCHGVISSSSLALMGHSDRTQQNTRIQSLQMLLSRRLIILDYSHHSRLTLRGEKTMCLPAHFWTSISQPGLFPRQSWLISPPEMPENHLPSCLGSWSPLETHGAGGISLSPPEAPSGWRPQADRSPVWGPYSTGCPHTATISFSSIVALSDRKQPYVREVTSTAWTHRWLDVVARCRLKSWIFSTLFTSLQALNSRCRRLNHVSSRRLHWFAM